MAAMSKTTRCGCSTPISSSSPNASPSPCSGLNEDDPARLLSGEALANAGVNGAVESDFFDWIVADAAGEKLVRRVMAHVRRFRLAEVESDVMKTLYKSLIDREQRHGLGEYYTPDWLAAKMARHAIDRPLEQKVLDPACGSGTFLFHAIRRFLAEAEESGTPRELRAREAARIIAGIDIHPVAVIIARVCFLLALAPVLAARRGNLKVPVYLGDALQLAVTQHFADKTLTIQVPSGSGEPAAALDFPELLCRDPDLFDETVDILRRASESGLPRAEFENRVERAIKDYYVYLRTRFTEADIRDYGAEEARAVNDIGATYLFMISCAARAAIRSGPMSRATSPVRSPIRPGAVGRMWSSAIRPGSRSGT